VSDTVRIVVIADTHGLHRGLQVPEGDILVHAGDLTDYGELDQLAASAAFLEAQPHRHKVVIAGNHDFCLERRPREARATLTNCIYLQDEAVTLMGLRFYGSPWQPWFFDWAFNLQRGPEIRAKWDLVPAGTDVLITHGPPWGHGDLTHRGERAGCQDLLEAVRRLRPALHLFGHIHEGYGVTRDGGTVLVNASICDSRNRPVNRPIVLAMDRDGGAWRVGETASRHLESGPAAGPVIGETRAHE
jgi:Icc-related predicted phosphoesterase